MIRALITGELVANPQERTGKTGKAFALARVSVPQGEDGRIFCSVIAFNDDAVARLLQLKAGASVSLAGALKVGTWQAKDGTAHPSLDLVADEAASTTPRPRKPKAQAGGASAGDPFGDLPGAGDVDWLGA
jgi:single-stranded DNA-binding protein